MASAAQILANRRNAEKSTGPRTEEGKAISSQNAVTHGLLARRDVISGEDPAEFDVFREEMLGELSPAGPMETVLAERIVSLSWRLKRVERMQNAALDGLFVEENAALDGENAELGSFGQNGDAVLGRAVVKDFGVGRALERLMMYERRIEHSLYRTMNELRTLKMGRRMRREEEAARRWNMEHSSGASRPIPEPQPVITGTPYGVVAAGRGESCKTNPIGGGLNTRGRPPQDAGAAAESIKAAPSWRQA